MSSPATLVVGGAVKPGEGVYIVRDSDAKLLAHCLAGEYAYILSTRQVGKSSLMVHAIQDLIHRGASPVIVDLSILGDDDTSAVKWFKGMLTIIEQQLPLETSVRQWWARTLETPAAHMFTRFLQEVVLREVTGRIVIFVDEVESVLNVPFGDDVLIAIRALYNARATNPELNRLSFVFAGSARPADLIQDGNRTPFNIGFPVGVPDFTVAQCKPLIYELPVDQTRGLAVLERVHYWTGGHPYLTLKTFESLQAEPPSNWSAAEIDRRVAELFWGPRAEGDSNLLFVRNRLTVQAPKELAVLGMYRRVLGWRGVRDEDRNPVCEWLKLTGVVRGDGGVLRIRNRIYGRVFDKRWLNQVAPRSWLRIVRENWTVISSALAAALFVLLGIAVWRLLDVAEAKRQTDEALRGEAAQRRAAEASRLDAVGARDSEGRANEGLAAANTALANSQKDAERRRLLSDSLLVQTAEPDKI